MNDAVVLLHGSGRSLHSMSRMAKALAQHNYKVFNLGYPSRRLSIEGLSDFIGNQIAELNVDQNTKIHFVTHSLGGIVLRFYLKSNHLPNLGRVVMLAPPNQGLELVDIFGQNPIFDWLIGPVGNQLGTNPDSLPNSLGPADYPVGIIAGNISINPFFSPLIPGADDGRVSVSGAKLAGMADFCEGPYMHTFIMYYRHVVQQTINFLEQGSFQATVR